MTELPNTLVLSSEDARHDLERFYPEHKCRTQVVHFVSCIAVSYTHLDVYKRQDPEDTHAFAEKIDQIFADENRLKEMGTRSYERAHAFAFEEVAKGCIDALCYVMGKAVR